jgi:hypothetical protein
MLSDEEKNEIADRAIMVTADRVDSLVSRPVFGELTSKKALDCLKQCVKAAMLETDHIHYDIITKSSKKRILVNVKMFPGDELDYDIQLAYSIED